MLRPPQVKGWEGSSGREGPGSSLCSSHRALRQCCPDCSHSLDTGAAPLSPQGHHTLFPRQKYCVSPTLRARPSPPSGLAEKLLREALDPGSQLLPNRAQTLNPYWLSPYSPSPSALLIKRNAYVKTKAYIRAGAALSRFPAQAGLQPQALLPQSQDWSDRCALLWPAQLAAPKPLPSLLLTFLRRADDCIAGPLLCLHD